MLTAWLTFWGQAYTYNTPAAVVSTFTERNVCQPFFLLFTCYTVRQAYYTCYRSLQDYTGQGGYTGRVYQGNILDGGSLLPDSGSVLTSTPILHVLDLPSTLPWFLLLELSIPPCIIWKTRRHLRCNKGSLLHLSDSQFTTTLQPCPWTVQQYWCILSLYYLPILLICLWLCLTCSEVDAVWHLSLIW